jgi:alpha-L-fucosidase
MEGAGGGEGVNLIGGLKIGNGFVGLLVGQRRFCAMREDASRTTLSHMHPVETSSLAVPSAQQLSWQRTETNLFIHFGLNTFTGREWGDGTESPAIFNPTKLDCRQWAKTARAGGFKIGILTAKHHDGFCLWPSKLTSHSVASSPWRDGKGDLVREFVDAFRSEGLKVGLYLSPWDRHEPCYGDSPRYNDFYCAQLTELLTQYGELDEVWFDGACAEGPTGKRQVYDWPRFFSLVKELQPNAVTFGDGGTDVRWVGNERGFSGETCWSTVDPRRVKFPGDSGIDLANDAVAKGDNAKFLNEGEAPEPGLLRVWRPAECDVSIRPGWFYHAEEDDHVRQVEELVDLYFRSVGRNGLLLLNLPPTRDGLIHPTDASRVAAYRSQIDCIFSDDLALDAHVTADGEDASVLVDGCAHTYWESIRSTEAMTIDIRLKRPCEVGVVSLREAIAFGQRVSVWRLESVASDGVSSPVSSGTTIGLKRLLRIPPVTTAHLRLVIEHSYGPAILEGIGLFRPVL